PRGRIYSLLLRRDQKRRDPLIVSDIAAGTLDLDVRLAGERWITIVARDASGQAVPVRGANVWDAKGIWLVTTNEAQPDDSLRMHLPAVPFTVYAVTPGWKNPRRTSPRSCSAPTAA